MKNPSHLGDFVKTEIVEAFDFSVTAAALGVSRPTLSSLPNGKSGLSGDMVSAHRKSIRHEDGHADAEAVGLGDCRDAQAGEADSRARGCFNGLRWNPRSQKRDRRHSAIRGAGVSFAPSPGDGRDIGGGGPRISSGAIFTASLPGGSSGCGLLHCDGKNRRMGRPVRWLGRGAARPGRAPVASCPVGGLSDDCETISSPLIFRSQPPIGAAQQVRPRLSFGEMFLN
jgi:hypothetical protein